VVSVADVSAAASKVHLEIVVSQFDVIGIEYPFDQAYRRRHAVGDTGDAGGE
jgi:hypothetical protein